MSTITITLNEAERQSLEKLAKRENLSLEECATMLLSEQLTEVDEHEYLKLRAAKGRRESLLKLLKKAPDVPPDAGDEINS